MVSKSIINIQNHCTLILAFFMKHVSVTNIEILVIEGASGILDFLLYSHCTQ